MSFFTTCDFNPLSLQKLLQLVLTNRTHFCQQFLFLYYKTPSTNIYVDFVTKPSKYRSLSFDFQSNMEQKFLSKRGLNNKFLNLGKKILRFNYHYPLTKTLTPTAPHFLRLISNIWRINVHNVIIIDYIGLKLSVCTKIRNIRL